MDILTVVTGVDLELLKAQALALDEHIGFIESDRIAVGRALGEDVTADEDEVDLFRGLLELVDGIIVALEDENE